MGVATFGGSLLSGNKNHLQIELAFSDGIDGLPDYRMGESADIEEIEFFTDSEVESYTASIVLHDAPLRFSLYPVPVSHVNRRKLYRFFNFNLKKRSCC